MSRRAKLLHDAVDQALGRGVIDKRRALCLHWRLHYRLKSGSYPDSWAAYMSLANEMLTGPRFESPAAPSNTGSYHIKKCRFGYHDVCCSATGERLMTAFSTEAEARHWAARQGLLPALSDDETLKTMNRLGWAQ